MARINGVTSSESTSSDGESSSHRTNDWMGLRVPRLPTAAIYHWVVNRMKRIAEIWEDHDEDFQNLAMRVQCLVIALGRISQSKQIIERVHWRLRRVQVSTYHNFDGFVRPRFLRRMVPTS